MFERAQLSGRCSCSSDRVSPIAGGRVWRSRPSVGAFRRARQFDRTVGVGRWSLATGRQAVGRAQLATRQCELGPLTKAPLRVYPSVRTGPAGCRRWPQTGGLVPGHSQRAAPRRGSVVRSGCRYGLGGGTGATATRPGRLTEIWRQVRGNLEKRRFRGCGRTRDRRQNPETYPQLVVMFRARKRPRGVGEQT